MVQWITDYLRNYKDYFNQGTNTFFDVYLEGLNNTPQYITENNLKDIKISMFDYFILHLSSNISDVWNIINENELLNILENTMTINENTNELRNSASQIHDTMYESFQIDDYMDLPDITDIEVFINDIRIDFSYKTFIYNIVGNSPITTDYMNGSIEFRDMYLMKDLTLVEEISNRPYTRNQGPSLRVPSFTPLGQILVHKDILEDFLHSARNLNPNIASLLHIETAMSVLTPWPRDLDNYFITLFRNYCGSDITLCSKTNNMKSILLFDNIHDFGKSREGYVPKQFNMICNDNDPNCIVNYLLRLIGDKTIGNFYDQYKITDNRNYFGSQWELHLLQVLTEKQNRTYIPYIGTTTYDDIVNKLLEINPPILWAHDTVSPTERMIMSNLQKTNKIVLDSSAFDGFKETFPNMEDPGRCTIGEVKFSLENPYKNEMITYELGGNQLIRHFDSKYGTGGTDTRSCTTENGTDCDYIRTDVITNTCRASSQVADRVWKVASEAVDKINITKDQPRKKKVKDVPIDLFDKSDTGFFLTLKALGDLAQVLEAKDRNIVFFTQDSMQFLIGAVVGTKIIKALRSSNVFYANMLGATVSRTSFSIGLGTGRKAKRRGKK